MIPGSSVQGRQGVQWRRKDDAPQGRVYHAKSGNGFLVAVVSHDPAGANGELLWHVSISHRDKDNQPDRCPTWDEMKSAKYQLVPDDVPMVLIFPRKSADYIDVYATCLHLWESKEWGLDGL